jgi:hypothetical protein
MLMPPSLLLLTCRGSTTYWELLRDDIRARSSLKTCAAQQQWQQHHSRGSAHKADAANLVWLPVLR